MFSFSSSLDYLSSLNTEQKKAVETTEGSLLVLAGAGTGKTKVLTSRAAHLLLSGLAWASELLIVTFTNKAASEMKFRMEQLIHQNAQNLWLGTFHSLCARILRQHAALLGLTSHFTILDTDDQLRVIKQILKNENLDDKEYPSQKILWQINHWKDRALTPDHLTPRRFSFAKAQDETFSKIYLLYQKNLLLLNSVDFGDLILLCLEIFKNHPEVLKTYQQKFRYILVDEYQDTNIAQYLLLRLLSQGHNNICCVGDDDQSIYGWRGAEVSNILRFEKDFPNAQIIRLEKNYRSTGHILGAASGLISYNAGRFGKTLWTDGNQGEKILAKAVWDSEEEAYFIGEEIENFQRKGKILNSMAILVRTSAQTREFEERLLTLGIPYRVIGGPRFYERREVRDVIAYLRVIHQPQDNLAFERIINLPRRGIGKSTLQVLHRYARQNQISFIKAAEILLETDEIKGKAYLGLQTLLKQFEEWRFKTSSLKLKDLTEIILRESGYKNMWESDPSLEAEGRLENIKELVGALGEFENLESFLEHISLVMDNTATDNRDMVNIMTIHSAKGLEFDVVFLPGWEEGLFPHIKSFQEQKGEGLEEERRLAYVALTRAKKHVIITFANNRNLYGEWNSNMPSRFINELPATHVQIVKQKGFRVQEPSFKQRGYETDFHYSQSFFKQPTSSSKSTLISKPVIFEQGQRVFHLKFGYGWVQECEGDKVGVNFEHSGLKKVIAHFLDKA